MPKSKSKKKPSSTKKPAGGKKQAMVANGPLYIIQVTGGIPVNPTGNANPGQLIQFQNNDQNTYAIRFIMNSNEYTAGILLPPKGTTPGLCVLTASAAGTVTYDLDQWATAASRERVATGGPHTIVISSGTIAKAATAAG
jgi:hypothetical protein